jgi:hypothetical protein
VLTVHHGLGLSAPDDGLAEQPPQLGALPPPKRHIGQGRVKCRHRPLTKGAKQPDASRGNLAPIRETMVVARRELVGGEALEETPPGVLLPASLKSAA